jgi:P4 family phage/plasmid primase-like protien
MKLDEFLDEFKVPKNSETIVTHTSMNGGKWHIPENRLNSFYKKVVKYVIQKKKNMQLVEKMGDFHPLLFDIDLKYEKKIDTHKYNSATIFQIVSFLWLNLSNLLDLEESKKLSEIWIMEKNIPYPCKGKKYESKDGIHIFMPNITIRKDTYRKIIKYLQDQGTIDKIFEETCDILPSNIGENTILDGCFSGIQPYGCSKQDEDYYKLTSVYRIEDDIENPVEINDKEFQESYTNDLTIMKKISLMGHTEENIKYKETLNELVDNGLKKTTSNTNTGMVNDIYGGNNVYYVDHNDIINPYELVETNEKELIKGLVSCLSKDRSTEYAKWLAVGMLLHNINPDYFGLWCEFSSQDESYDEEVCNQKWESFNNNHTGDKLGKGSLYHWAKCDNKLKYYEVMKYYLDSRITESISHGPDAHHLIALVISKYFENQFICVDINDDWYWFNGVRWAKTMKGNKLKKCIHDDIHKIYREYGDEYLQKSNELANQGGDPDEIDKFRTKFEKCLSFQKKLYQEPYVNTIIGSLKHIFYQEGIMEEFDTNNELIGFENGIYDLRLNLFREGRPEDYITLSTKIILPINGIIRPGETQERFRNRSIPDGNIELEELNERISDVDNFEFLKKDLQDFISQIIPDEEVRNYTIQFISKCLSGENRDEEFNIWTGSGGNGKSKLVELIRSALGDYACNLPVALLTQKRKASGAACPEMARTRGKRFVFMQEPDVNETLNVGEMKEITGNDKIQARGLYKEPFEFTPQFKLLLMCNQLPNIPSNDDGTWRRLRAVPFVSRFVKPSDVDIKLHRYPIDTQLQKKLGFWVVPFMTILFEEWKEYDRLSSENKIVIPDAVLEKTNDYRNSNDLIGQFISDCCVEAENITIGVNEFAPTEFDNIYAEFSEWCNEQEEKNRPDKKSVKEAFMHWQEKSKFGLSISKRKTDNLPNGSLQKPRFNLKVE